MSIDQMLWRQTIGLMMTTCCKKTRTTTNHRCRFLSIGSLTEFDLLNEAASAICWDHKLSVGLMMLLMFLFLYMFSCGGHVMVSKFCEKILRSRGFDPRKVLSFFLLFLSLSSVSLIRSLKEVQQYWFSSTKKWC